LSSLAPGGPRRLAVLPAACLALVLAASGCGSSSHAAAHPQLGFGTLPPYLPKNTAPVDRIVTASPGRPQLAVQGVSLQVDLPEGRVLATVTGPQVPPFVAPPPPEVTATFNISLAHASGTVPVRLTDFTITDQLGRTFEPTLVTGEAAPPPSVRPGPTVSFQVTAVMPTGDGRLHWSPTGSPPIASWDFIVEND
jgi:hypothetical protein